MNNNIKETASFGYRGFVNLKLRIKDKVVELHKHNTGTNYLFKSFYKFLTGNYDKNDIPTYIDLRRAATGEETFSTILNADVHLSAENYTSSEASFNGIIRYDNIISGTVVESGYDYRLYLLSNYNSETVRQELAYISISYEDLSKITAGISLIVEWFMTVSNYTAASV